MSPKKANKPSAAAAAASPSEPEYQNPNVEWHNKVNDALDTIKGHYGLGIVDASPLTLEEGGKIAPIDWEVMESRLTSTDDSDPVVCSGGVNVLWGNPCQSQTPSVRINVRAIELMSQNLWGGGKIVPLLEPVDFVAKPMVKGKPAEFERVSPEEPVQGLLVWIAQRIKDDADGSELDQWKTILLSSFGRLIKLETWDSRYFHCVNSRRRTADLAKTVVHLASQICQDIWLFRKRKESLMNKTLTNAEVAKLYAESMPDTAGDEEPRSDENVIQRACLVYEKILSNEVVARCIQWSEESYGAISPWNSIGKLVEIQSKLKKAASIEFFFSSMKVALLNDQMEPGDLSLKKLRGGGGSGGKVGLLDVIQTKKAMRDFLLHRWMDLQHNISPEHKALLRKMFATADTYKKHLIVTCLVFLHFFDPSSRISLLCQCMA